MYLFERIYCGAPWELEDERLAFVDGIGAFNETQAQPQGLLYVPVSLGSTANKRAYQSVVNDNIRASTYYLQLLDTAPFDGWGPPERNFERDFALALRCVEDPALPMRAVAVLLKQPACYPAPFSSDIATAEFDDMNAFQTRLRSLLARWHTRVQAHSGA